MGGGGVEDTQIGWTKWMHAWVVMVLVVAVVLMLNDERHTISNARWATDDGRKGDKRSTTSDGRWTTNDRRHAKDNRRREPTDEGRWAVVDRKRWATGG